MCDIILVPFPRPPTQSPSFLCSDSGLNTWPQITWLPKKIYPQRNQGLGQVSTRVCLQINMLALGCEHLAGWGWGALMGVRPWETDLSLGNGPTQSLKNQDEVQTPYVVSPKSHTSQVSWSPTLSLPMQVAQHTVEDLSWLLLEFRYFSGAKTRFRNDQSFTGLGGCA